MEHTVTNISVELVIVQTNYTRGTGEIVFFLGNKNMELTVTHISVGVQTSFTRFTGEIAFLHEIVFQHETVTNISIEVGVQTSYTRGTGEIVFFLGNKNMEHAVTNISVEVVNPSPSVHLTVGSAPVSMPPKQQMQVPIHLACLGPMEEPPTVCFSYNLCNVVVSQELKLPVANHKFMVPEVKIPTEVFFAEWKALSTPPHKAQEMFERAGALTTDAIANVLRSASLGVEHGYLDPSPHNEAGAAYFCSLEGGQKQTTLVLCRVEGKPQTMCQFRVTVESPSPVVAASIKDMIVLQLQALPA
eukprot:gene20228-26981_t